ncbi:MAG TPA: UDP-N-acetylglucosamine 2-epimerase (non-hydrolyzing) [Chloroflexi bacterium]|nr:UDP-N-acetylglucosamine 2-epimerase (non-hydrolyzing) [Chloroflexota bacterium]
MKIVSIIGARPQFIKAAAVSRLLRKQHTEILVHTGQHYDANMSAIFFDELGIPKPEVNLKIGSGRHGAQTGAMLAHIEEILLKEKPDWVLIYGDTNSTLAGALAAAKLHIPVAHVEAGLRSFNRKMPEEVNRVLADHVSTLLLCSSQTAVDNLAVEGITQGVHLIGDVMLDAQNYAVKQAAKRSNILAKLALKPGKFMLATVHRAENTDDEVRLRGILSAFEAVKAPVVLPIHPRTRKMIEVFNLKSKIQNLKLIEPVGYLDMVMLEKSARMILTDSGGIQKEAYWLGVPCITLRDETEWPETVETGWNVIVSADEARIVEAVRGFARPEAHPALYGDGMAGRRCVALLG